LRTSPSHARQQKTNILGETRMPDKAEIEELAHSLWEGEGKPVGQEPVYLLEAERLLKDLDVKPAAKARRHAIDDRDGAGGHRPPSRRPRGRVL